MNTQLKTKLAAACMVLGMSLAGAAQAQVSLVPGSTVFSNPGGLEGTALGSFSLLASMNSPFVANDPTKFSGVLDSWVVSGDTNNELGGLNFIYRLANDENSANAIHRLTVNGYTGVTVNAGFLTSGSTPTGAGTLAGLDPTLADRGIPPGDNVGFSFLAGTISGLTFESLNPGEISRYLVLYTDATAYGTNMASVIDGSIADAATFAPIPEPGTYALMLAGLGLMGFVGRRRSMKNAA